jgi:type 1 fimbria pilin
MNSKKTIPMFFSIAFLGACLATGSDASARGNTLAFSGRLVNAGCDAKVLTSDRQQPELKALKVSANLTLGLVSHDDACDEAAVPVSTAYLERSAIMLGARSGIVTLTYQ